MALRSAWRQSYPGLAAIFVFSFFINLVQLAVPFYLYHLLDRVLASRSLETLVLLTVITIGAVMAGALVEFVRRWMLIRWGAWIEHRFGRQLFLSGLTSRSESRPTELLRDLASLRQFVASSAATAWLDVIWVPAFVIVVYLIHPLIALVIAVGMAIMLALGLFNELLTRRARSAATQATLDRGDWLATAERNAEAIGSLNISSNLADRWHVTSKTRLDENLWTRLNSLVTADSMHFVERCQRIACYGFGIWLVILGSLSVGGVIAAAILGRIASSAFRRAMTNWRNLRSARSAYFRLKKKLSEDREPEALALDKAVPLALHIEDVSHRYPEQTRSIVRNFSLAIQPGEMLCVVGPSGSGKSTLTRLITGRLAPRSGVVRLGEVDITRYPRDELFGYVGYLQQDIHLFRGAVSENIACLGPSNGTDLIEAAKLVGIHEVIIRLPRGYETEIGEDPNYLSAGERKRIALARAIHGRPRLVVLDEPESNLDENAREALDRTLQACKAWGAIVIVTTQSLSLTAKANKVAILDETSKARTYSSKEEISDLRRAVRKERFQERPDKKLLSAEES